MPYNEREAKDVNLKKVKIKLEKVVLKKIVLIQCYSNGSTLQRQKIKHAKIKRICLS